MKQYYDKQAIDTKTPAGKAMIHMCVVFSEFERDLIRERVHQGLQRASRSGEVLGASGDRSRNKKIKQAVAKGDRDMLRLPRNPALSRARRIKWPMRLACGWRLGGPLLEAAAAS